MSNVVIPLISKICQFLYKYDSELAVYVGTETLTLEPFDYAKAAL